MDDTALVFAPIPARRPPYARSTAIVWMRRNLFSSWASTLGTLVLLLVLGWCVPKIFSWAVLHAVYKPDLLACRAAEGVGACWGVVAEKGRLILFGRFPYEDQWRPLCACVISVLMLAASGIRYFWRRWLIAAWAVVIAAYLILMHGGILGLAIVDTSNWGGLPLTLALSVVSLGLAFPLAVVIALGRASALGAIRTMCTMYVEFVRGVPLISVLFMASFMFPLMLPQGVTVNVLLRVLAGMTLFAAAYLAEGIRGGLQALPKGQFEAAHALGLGYWRTACKIVLPQALAIAVPGLMNTIISIFKDTSLVTIVSLYDLTGALQLALADADWRRFFLEGQLFVAAIYFAFCFSMAWYSRWIEAHLNAGRRHV
jgi:general L-amino acid transport system permease protein